jgi:hypothetical protein
MQLHSSALALLSTTLLMTALTGCASRAETSDKGTEPRAESTSGAPASAEWIELFDGQSLEGWTTVGGRYDGHARWTIEEGAVTGRQGPGREGGLIYTAATYADFELELDLKIDWPFDSGIFLRMLPPESGQKGLQVTIDHRDGGECGGLYADGWILHNPEGWSRFQKGEWNHFRVLCQGQPMRVQAWLNREPLVEHVLESAEGYAASGRIGLQVHGGEDVPLETKVQFKNVRLRPL